jgi:hypothetical protein
MAMAGGFRTARFYSIQSIQFFLAQFAPTYASPLLKALVMDRRPRLSSQCRYKRAVQSLVSVDTLIKPRKRSVCDVTPHRLREWTFEGPNALKPLRPGATTPEFWL